LHCPEADLQDVGNGPKPPAARQGETRHKPTLGHCPIVLKKSALGMLPIEIERIAERAFALMPPGAVLRPASASPFS
jgi:hypothetical protein